MRKALVVLTLLFVSPTIAGEAHADDKAACADAYKSAQTDRKSGSLKKAREALLFCASDRCPAIIQPDCVRWLSEVESVTPSVVFAAKGSDGKDVSDVRVSIDGEIATETLDGKSLAIDPGSHKVKFERAGELPIVQEIVVREGEKARVVSASWAKVETKSEEPTPAPPPPVLVQPTNTAAWVFAGVGVVSLATFGTVAALAYSRRSELRTECFGSCSQADIDSVKRQFLAADIALGVGVLSLGVATVLFLNPPRAVAADAPRVSLSVAPSTGGGFAFLSGRF